MPPKVLVVGLDGGTFDMIRPLAEAGRLPQLARLMRQGVSADLQSTLHPITAAAWTSFATGCNPGRHGIFDFETPVPGSYHFRLNSARNRGAEPFWSIMGRAGLRTTIVNIPFTYPPDPTPHGIVISGFDAPEAGPGMSAPPEVYAALKQRFGRYTPDWTFPTGRRMTPDAYARQVHDAIVQRTQTSLFLMERYPWDVFVVVYGSLDHLQHIDYGQGEAGHARIAQAYEAADSALGTLIERAGPDTTVMIVSDHGFGEIRKVIHLDQWLAEAGFLAFQQGVSAQRTGRWMVRWARRTFKRLLPAGWRRLVRLHLPAVRDFMVSHAAGPEIDWTRTQAYSGGMYGNIYINLKDAHPSGIVDPADYDAVCDRIADALMRLNDPDTGEPVVEKVHRRAQLYQGPYVDRAPDLIVQWKDYAYFTKKRLDPHEGQVFSRSLFLDASAYPHTGTHRLNGIFIAVGPGIRSGEILPRLHIEDVAPTLLAIMGLPPTKGMDGKVTRELFETPPSLTTPEPHDDTPEAATPTPGADDGTQDAELRARLRSLGYI